MIKEETVILRVQLDTSHTPSKPIAPKFSKTKPYKNDQPEWRNTYYRGLLHGLSTKWDISGQKIREGYFNNGDSSGVWFWWNINGELIGKKSFNNTLLKNNGLNNYQMKLNK